MENRFNSGLRKGFGVMSLGLAAIVGSACGDEYITNEYNYPDANGPEKKGYDCEKTVDHLVSCGALTQPERQEYLEGCQEYAPKEWFECIYSQPCEWGAVENCSYLVEK